MFGLLPVTPDSRILEETGVSNDSATAFVAKKGPQNQVCGDVFFKKQI